MFLQKLKLKSNYYNEIRSKKRKHLPVSKEEKKFVRRYDLSTCLCGVVLGLLAYFIITGVFGFGCINGSSMYPTYKDGQIIRSEKADFSKIDKGSVIIAKYKPDGYRLNVKIIKRVIGEPGDIVTVKGGFYYVNDRCTNIPTNEYSVYTEKLLLLDDEYFIVGDNYNESLDSRVFGPINKNNIIRMLKED